MSEERMRVLDMVAAGTITPEQGEELLEILRDEPPSPRTVNTRARSATTRQHPRHARGSTTLEQLIRARDHGIDGEFVEGMQEVGLDHLDLDALIQLSSHGVRPEYIREMRDLGFSHLSLKDLIKLGSHGVRPQFIREMTDLGFTDLSIDDLARLSSHGVRPEFIREMHELGFIDLTAEQAVALHDRPEGEPWRGEMEDVEEEGLDLDEPE